MKKTLGGIALAYLRGATLAIAVCAAPAGAQPSIAGVSPQCPGDLNGDAVIDVPDPNHPRAKCMHLAAGDGFVTMADGRVLYVFGFSDMTGVPKEAVMSTGTLAANLPGPTIVVDEGDELYLSLTNVGMATRPDLSGAHSVHWDGFPNASAIFDGEPESTISIKIGSTLTYYFRVVEPGTYMYQCHVEPAQHTQMGMLGAVHVRPAQDRLADGTDLSGFTHHTGYRYAYNDGDGSTSYDVEHPIQIGSFDSRFHDASETGQPLPFNEMTDDYGMLNGRGYPDTLNPNPLPGPAQNGNKASQKLDGLVQATAGQKILLRISNLNATRPYTLATLGIPMKVVGVQARLLRGPDPDGVGPLSGKSLFYSTSSVTLGGGESADVILDTTGVAPGTYFLYTTNLNYLSNSQEDFGGMMTELRIN